MQDQPFNPWGTMTGQAGGWKKREVQSGTFVSLGDGEKDVKKVSGLLIAIPHNSMYPDKLDYVIVPKNGEELILSGSASLSRQINEKDIGKFIKCEFMEWAKSANGRYKVIEVNVFEGEPTDVMKQWPRYAEFHTAPKAKAPAKAEPADDFDDFGGSQQGTDDSDDLPF